MKAFKFATFVVLFLTSCMFISCSDDDDDKNNNSGDLIGTWESVRTIEWEKENGHTYGSTDWEEDTNLRYEFTSDGIAKAYSYYSISWHLDSEASYRYSNGKLVINFNEDGESYTNEANVLSLDANTLILETYQSEGGYEYYFKGEFRKI